MHIGIAREVWACLLAQITSVARTCKVIDSPHSGHTHTKLFAISSRKEYTKADIKTSMGHRPRVWPDGVLSDKSHEYRQDEYQEIEQQIRRDEMRANA